MSFWKGFERAHLCKRMNSKWELSPQQTGKKRKSVWSQ